MQKNPSSVCSKGSNQPIHFIYYPVNRGYQHCKMCQVGYIYCYEKIISTKSTAQKSWLSSNSKNCQKHFYL